jgi:hypothetical protein
VVGVAYVVGAQRAAADGPLGAQAAALLQQRRTRLAPLQPQQGTVQALLTVHIVDSAQGLDGAQLILRHPFVHGFNTRPSSVHCFNTRPSSVHLFNTRTSSVHCFTTRPSSAEGRLVTWEDQCRA